MFDKLPSFIPKVTDLTAFEGDFELSAVLMDLPHTKWRPVVAKKAVEEGVPLIVDPATVHLLYPAARDKKNFQKLSYGQDIVPEDLYSSSDERLNRVIIPAVTSQVDAGASVIVAPAFYSEDTEDIKFTLSLTLLSETLRYLDGQAIKMPTFASINLGKGVLLRPTVRHFVVDMYGGDFKDKIDGYFITINDLDDRKSDFDHLVGLADLVFQLSKDKHVFIKNVGGFGEVLSAIGCSGFSSGLGAGEMFSVKNLEARSRGFGRGGGWTYVPEIFDYANDV